MLSIVQDAEKSYKLNSVSIFKDQIYTKPVIFSFFYTSVTVIGMKLKKLQ